MKFDRRVWLLAACIITALASPLSLAQDYPNKAINFVVPFPPGGSNDVLAKSTQRSPAGSPKRKTCRPCGTCART